jgi:DNA ligase-associated metallophosphoesterase
MLKTKNTPSGIAGAFSELWVGGECLHLFPEKVAYLPSLKTLFVADCHFGKIAHFRKSGIGLPSHAGMETFGQLHRLLVEINPERLVFLGDVFHSEFNQDFDRFQKWRALFPSLKVDLILGNHDRAGFHHLNSLGMEIHSALKLGPFYCTHEPDFNSLNGFNLCGHLHPAVSLSVGSQHVKVPCFWKGENHLCFPSFGTFTGSVSIRPKADDLLFAISGNRIRPILGSVL